MATHPILAVVGPTGSGKSALAIYLAQQLRGEIINCDSLQLYRYFDIGTAKIHPDDQQGIPHHLIDVLDPDQLCTAGDFARMAREKLLDIVARDRLPVIAGGTGFYLRAMIDGLFEGPQRNDPLRSRLSTAESRRAGFLHRLLRRLDPLAASRIHKNDVNKLTRAVEVCLLARESISTLHAQGTEPLQGFHPVILGLDPPRAELYERLNERSEHMFNAGLVTEVKAILARGVSPSAKPFESLGYRQALLHIQGALSVEQAISDTQLQTRRYAKRQWTWFKKDTRVSWIPGFGHLLHLQQQALKIALQKDPSLLQFS